MRAIQAFLARLPIILVLTHSEKMNLKQKKKKVMGARTQVSQEPE